MLCSILDINECESSDNGGCDQNCTNFSGGYSCSCFEGYDLASDSRTCEGNQLLHQYNMQIIVSSIVTCVHIAHGKLLIMHGALQNKVMEPN